MSQTTKFFSRGEPTNTLKQRKLEMLVTLTELVTRSQFPNLRHRAQGHELFPSCRIKGAEMPFISAQSKERYATLVSFGEQFCEGGCLI